MFEIPSYGLRAYGLFYSQHGLREAFQQSELDWIVSASMRKKIFSVLTRAGWIRKVSRNEYKCVSPNNVFRHLLDFKVPEIIKEATKPYAFTGLSAVEIWSDYSYVQRGRARSPYFIKVLRKDLRYWTNFLNQRNIPNYVNEGATIGEFIILIPAEKVFSVERDGVMVEPLKMAMSEAQKNEAFLYAYNYMKRKYGEA